MERITINYPDIILTKKIFKVYAFFLQLEYFTKQKDALGSLAIFLAKHTGPVLIEWSGRD